MAAPENLPRQPAYSMTSLTLMDMPPEVRSLIIERLIDGITIYLDVPGCVQKEGRARRDRFRKGPPSPAEGARCEKKQRRVVVSPNNVRKGPRDVLRSLDVRRNR